MPVTAIEAAYFPQDNASIFTSSHYLYQQKLIQYIANLKSFVFICIHLCYIQLQKEVFNMANTLIQFRADETERMEAVSILQQLGLDMPSYLRMCVSRLVSAKGIPFSMTINQSSSNRGIEAMKRASRIAEENGISDMSLDEINAEIADARK